MGAVGQARAKKGEKVWPKAPAKVLSRQEMSGMWAIMYVSEHEIGI